MKRIVFWCALQVSFASASFAQQIPSVVPREVLAALHADYPDWHLLDNSGVLHTPQNKLDTSKSRPNVVWGDFDGNGHLDFAFFIARGVGSPPVEEKLVVYMAFGNRLQKFLLDSATAPGYIADMIWILHKGTREYNYETDRYFRLRNDAIDAITLEKAAQTYIFEKNRFRVVTTAD